MTRKRLIVIAIVLCLGIAAYVWASSRPQPLVASGTVEARDIRVGSKVGGRIEQVLVREGDKVEAGQVLATFDDRELKANMDASLANFQKLQRGFRPEEVAQVRAQAEQAKADYELRKNGNRREDIDAAQADADRAKADTVRTESTWKRVSDLSNQDVFSKQQRDDAESAYQQGQGRLKLAREKLAELERGTRPEEIRAAEAHQSQLAAGARLAEHGFRAEDIAAARAALE